MKNAFPKNLKTLRTEARLTQFDLATKLLTTQRRISYMEQGKVEPDLETLIDIADFFEITVDELIR